MVFEEEEEEEELLLLLKREPRKGIGIDARRSAGLKLELAWSVLCGRVL